ncbi:D-alanine-D-alanine ligase, partial [Brevibacterium jeotgali]
RDYKWASNAQRSFAASVTAAGADLVIGHGSHMAQEIDIHNGRPLLHGIGNFVFNSNGRYALMDAPPYSAAVRLHLTSDSTRIRLYPLHTDNGSTGFRTGPVDVEQFEEFYLEALSRTGDSAAFLRGLEPGADAQGHYLEIDLNKDHRARVNRHRRGQSRTLTYWDENPKKIRFDRRSSPNVIVLERELKRQGATIQRLDSGAFSGRSKEGVPYLMMTSSTHHSGVPGARAAKRKSITREILKDHDLSTAAGGFFSSQDDFDAAAALLGDLGPVVVKPMDGNVGRGVTVGIEDSDALRAAWDHAFSETRSGVLVEQQFRGDEIRISVVDGVACAATRRIPPQITGDGTSTIRELINARNDERHHELVLHSKPLDLTGNRLRTLLRAGFTPLTVLPQGVTHLIDHMGSVGSGAHPENCIETMDPSYLRIAESAALAFHDIDIAGIDILCEDLSQSANDENHIIIEVNTRPEVAVHSARPSDRAPQSFPTRLVSSVLASDPPRTFRPRVRRPVPPERLSSAALLAAEFTARDMDVTWYGDTYFRASGGGATASVWGSSTDRTGTAARFAARHDGLTQSLLRRARLPVRRAETPAPEGTRLCFLVAHSRVLAVIDPSDPRRRNLLRSVNQSHRALAAAASRAITGLDLAEVTLTASDPSQPGRRGTVVIDDVRPDPDLVAFAEAAAPRTDIVKTIVDLHLGAAEPASEPAFTWTEKQKGTPAGLKATVVDAARGAKRVTRGLRRRIGGD